ncbi:replicative DNA helicase [Mesoaciditoga sp.]
MEEKIMPQSKEAEEAVIGAIFLDPEAADTVFEILSSSDFYFTPTKVVFKAMEDLFKESEPIDVLSVTERLKVKKQLELVGGEIGVMHLADSVPIVSNVEYYAKVVKEKSILRQLISTASKIANLSYEQREVSEILDDAERMIFKIAEDRTTKTYLPLEKVINASFENIEKLKVEKESPEGSIYITGIPTGFRELDSMTAGLHKSDLVILAARPSLGKTSLALTLARNISLRYEHDVTFFSLEMSAEQLAQRMLCAEGYVDLKNIRSGSISPDDWRRLTDAAARLKNARMVIDDDPSLDVMKLRTKARKIKKEYGMDVMFVDYLQLMHSKTKHENRQQEISEISRSLKLLARELDVCVVALSQLSRAVEQRDEKRPRLSDLRESGAIEQDADVVMFIHREDYFRKKQKNAEDEEEFDFNAPKDAEIIIGKQRNGPIGSVVVSFFPRFASFYERDQTHE